MLSLFGPQTLRWFTSRGEYLITGDGLCSAWHFIGKSKTQNLQLLVVTLCNCLSVCLYASIQTYRYPNPLNIHDKSLPLDSL